jgi:NAD(P)-dependent dehydrogenase (short-subunit alcohol dehydrogenase family)
MRLENRVAVVTGVGSGLGKAIAHELASRGALVTGCDIDDTAGHETMDEIGRFVHADVSLEAEVAALIEGTVEHLGHVDIVVNNAAVQLERELVDTTEAQLDWILGVNLKGVFFGCKHAVRAMQPRQSGVIINISSVLGLVGDGLLPAYCAAKGGVLGITRATAVQYGRAGIRCNAVCPGDINTPLLERYFQSLPDPQASFAEISAEYPLGRIAEPNEVARSVAFLASDDSTFVSGQALIVDGGLLASCY